MLTRHTSSLNISLAYIVISYYKNVNNPTLKIVKKFNIMIRIKRNELSNGWSKNHLSQWNFIYEYFMRLKANSYVIAKYNNILCQLCPIGKYSIIVYQSINSFDFMQFLRVIWVPFL